MAKENLRNRGGKKLLATHSERKTVFHFAATNNEIEVFQGIFNLAKQNLTTEEVKTIIIHR